MKFLHNKLKADPYKPVAAKKVYDFVKEYTFVDPKNLLLDYECFASCETLPVACMSSENGLGWTETVQLPTEMVLPFLRKLKNTDYKKTYSVNMRKVFVVDLTHGKSVLITPNLENPANPIRSFFDNGKISNESNCAALVTPEISRAIAQHVNEIRVNVK